MSCARLFALVGVLVGVLVGGAACVCLCEGVACEHSLTCLRAGCLDAHELGVPHEASQFVVEERMATHAQQQLRAMHNVANHEIFKFSSTL
jgi:hypothetical protein